MTALTHCRVQLKSAKRLDTVPQYFNMNSALPAVEGATKVCRFFVVLRHTNTYTLNAHTQAN